jgi:hypothetical protein
MTFSFLSPIIVGMASLKEGLPVARIVKCKKCGCTINGSAIDPQTQHSPPDKAEPGPRQAVRVTCSCCCAAYRYSPVEVFKRSPGPSGKCIDRARNNKEENKPGAVLLIAASPIAAIRLNREDIRSSPAVHSKIADNMRLAEMIQARLQG